jgi:para-nitrobenzyl esterase
MLSGECGVLPLDVAKMSASTMVANLGCSGADRVSCLRQKTTEEVVTSLTQMFGVSRNAPVGPYVDGVLLADQPMALAATGALHTVPLLIGSTSEEFNTLVNHPEIYGKPVTNAEQYIEAAHAFFGPAVGDFVLSTYPASAFPSPMDAFVQALTDVTFTCPTRAELRALLPLGAPTFRYVFSGRFERDPLKQFGAGHSFDLPFLFHDLPKAEQSSAELALADEMVGAWTRFAATGDPGGGGLAWPRWDLRDPYIEFGSVVSARAGFRTALCDAWDMEVRTR